MNLKSKKLPQSYNCSGKTALITGGAGLLGEQHAMALLEIGAGIILTDINIKKLSEITQRLKKTYPSASIFPTFLDVTDLKQIRKLSSSLTIKKRRVDILINNAALDPKVERKKPGVTEASRLENFSPESWAQEIQVGLTGAFLCSQVFGTGMAADKKGGVILNIASDLSVLAPDQRIYKKRGVPASRQPVKPVTYSVIKSGLVGLTRYLATYWAHRNIRANALSPGGVYTSQPKEFVRKLESLIPLNRMAERQEYRAAVQFLCSNASAYLTGQNIIMDGGRSVW